MSARPELKSVDELRSGDKLVIPRLDGGTGFFEFAAPSRKRGQVTVYYRPGREPGGYRYSFSHPTSEPVEVLGRGEPR